MGGKQKRGVAGTVLKALGALLLAGALIASGGPGINPAESAHAASAAEPTPPPEETTTITVIPDLEPVLPFDVREAIDARLLSRPAGKLAGDQLIITGIRLEDAWGLVTVVSGQAASEARAAGLLEFSLLQPGQTETLLVVRQGSAWSAAFSGMPEFTDLVQSVPESELSIQARAAFMPQGMPRDGGPAVLFPWRYTDRWMLSQGWHGTPLTALDFSPVGATTREVLAVTGATVIAKCGPDAVQVNIATSSPDGNWSYVHLDKNQPYPNIGDVVPQGAVIGRIFSTPGSFNSTCGWGTGPHLHLIAPSQNFTMDGWTPDASNVWLKPGQADKTVYDIFNSTNGHAPLVISGNAGIDAAVLAYENNGPQTATADGAGEYTISVPYGWTGTVTPSKLGHGFLPSQRAYAAITADQTGQDYAPFDYTRADFDGDADADVSVYRSGIWYVKDQFSVPYGGLLGDIPLPGDYDGDGDADVAIYRPSTGTWYIKDLFSVGFGGVPGDIPAPGDYNGDGTTDIAIFRGGLWYIKDQAAVSYGAPGDIPVPADYDGNDSTDVAVYRSGMWYVQDQFSAAYGGVPSDIPVPADYDGDGEADPAVYRSGMWYVKDLFSVAYGGDPADVPIPADYDGDGDTDVAVYRNGTWYVKDLFSMAYGGVPGDFPLPASDTNGDADPYQ